MRYRYTHEQIVRTEQKCTRTLFGIWRAAGLCTKANSPIEHPRHRFPEQFKAFESRGYLVIYLCGDGDRCSLYLKRNQTTEYVRRDIEECLGWEYSNEHEKELSADNAVKGAEIQNKKFSATH